MTDPTRLRKALEDSGGAWLLDYWGSQADEMLEQAARGLEEFASEYERRFPGEQPDPFALLAENPAAGRAFFQVDTLAASVEMKIMVWRILLGCEIKQVDFHYQAGGHASLQVVLQAPGGGEDPPYQGDPARDYRVLRHFGTSLVHDRLLLQGYYAFKP